MVPMVHGKYVKSVKMEVIHVTSEIVMLTRPCAQYRNKNKPRAQHKSRQIVLQLRCSYVEMWGMMLHWNQKCFGFNTA
eukprot:3452843-Amphidinium_carterae.1